MRWRHRKVQDSPRPRPTCSAIAKDGECICYLEPHSFDKDHKCPCGFTWTGDPDGPDFIRLED